MSTKRKVYTFYIIAILVMVLVLMLFDLNIMAKAIVGLMIVCNEHETAFCGMNYYLLSVEDSSNRLIAIYKKPSESST